MADPAKEQRSRDVGTANTMADKEEVMNRTRTFALASGLLTVAYIPVGAQGHAHAKSSSPPAASRAHTGAQRGASADETRTIHDYYRHNTEEVKPIPPGILRNLARGK